VATVADPPLPPVGRADDSSRRPSTFSSVAFAYSTQVAVAVLSLGNVLIVARALGPTGRGDVVFLITIAILSSQFASLSVSEAISVRAGTNPEQRPSLASNAAVLAAVLGLATVAALVLLVLGIPGIGPHLSVSLWAMALAVIAPLILQEYLSRLAMAEYRFSIANAAFLVPAVFQVVVNGSLYSAGELTVARAMLAWVGGQLLALMLLVLGVVRSGAGFGRPDPTLGRSMVGFGLKAHGSRSLMWGNYRLDMWLVGALAGSRELGLYSVAVAWAEGLFLLPQAIAIIQRPDLVRDDAATAGRRAATGFRLATLASVPLVLGLVLAAPFLCEMVFGADFGGSAGMLRVLSVGGFGIVAAKLLGSALIAQKRPLLETIATAGAFVVTVVLDVVLIPGHGGMGAAIASSTAYMIGGSLVALIAARTLRFSLGDLVPTLSDVHSARGMLGVLRRRTA
jgi:O-antigen/teichoic acid export membrane protein